MTVKQLIAKLQRLDPQAEVYIETRQCLEGTKEHAVTVRKVRKTEHEREFLDCPAIVIE